MACQCRSLWARHWRDSFETHPGDGGPDYLQVSGRTAKDETFQQFIKCIGKAECKKMLEDLMQVPPHESDPSFYQDWGDAREYTVGDLGQGECAGEVISPAEFQLTAAERQAFEAQLALEKDDIAAARKLAYEAMHGAALGLLKQVGAGFPDDPDTVLRRFRENFYDTQLFYDTFTGGKFAHYYFDAHEKRHLELSAEATHYLIEEALVFIEMAHTCYARLLEKPAVAV
jgi:sulfite reductase (ferredoxin)